MAIRILSKYIFRKGRFEEGELWFEKGKIIDPKAKATSIWDFTEFYIIPAFIDLQVNGGFGIDLTKEPHKVERLAKELRKEGVGAFLPTLITSPKETYQHHLKYLQPRYVDQGAFILGIHLEGPYLNPAYAGAHDPELFLPCSEEIPLQGVRLVTLAPELPGSDTLIRRLREKNIAVAAGHSEASYEMCEFFNIDLVTHLYNAMGPFHHRQPSLIDYALISSGFYSVIADHKHISSTALEFTAKANPDGLVLVSDMSPSHGSQNEKFTLGSKTFNKGDLAGSDLSLLSMVKKFPGPLELALRATTTHPASLLGAINRGRLDPGSDAEFNVFDKNMNLLAYMNNGEVFTLD